MKGEHYTAYRLSHGPINLHNQPNHMQICASLIRHGSTGESVANGSSVSNGHPVLPASTDRQAFESTWYCEIRNYDFNNPTFKGGFPSNCQNVNGHFTQVVWKDTRQLGCGRATCTIKSAIREHTGYADMPPLATVNTRMYLFYIKKFSVRNATGDVTFYVGL